MVRRLVLIKHARPRILPELPACEWELSAEGREDASAMAEKLRRLGLEAVLSSAEPKAVETARIVAKRLELPFEIRPGLHEHERAGVPFLEAEEFRRRVGEFFARPGERVLGEESADQTSARFYEAVRKGLGDYRNRSVAIVTHGTVISLFAARVAGCEPYPLWARLLMPSWVAFSLPEMGLEEVVERG